MVLDLQFLPQQVFRALRANFQNFLHREKMRLIVDDDAGVRRDGILAIRESIKRVHRHFRRNARGNFDGHFDVFRRVVGYAFDLDLAFVIGFQDAVDEGRRGCAIRNFANGEGRFVHNVDPGAHLHATAPLAALVVAYVDHTAGVEIRKDLDLFTFQDFDRSLDEFDEIVW